MTGILDGRVELDGASVETTGIKALRRDAEAVGVAATDLKELTYRLALPIAALGATLAPRRSGRLAAGIRPSRSKRKVMVRVGTSRLAYAGAVHWGWDSRSGPRFLSVAEERMRPRTLAGLGEGIRDLLTKYNW